MPPKSSGGKNVPAQPDNHNDTDEDETDCLRERSPRFVRKRDSLRDSARKNVVGCNQGSHSTWKTWKNESAPGKPGNIMEF